MRQTALTALFALPVMLAAEVGSAQDITRATPYSGRRLEGAVFLCRSDNVTAGGFRKELDSGKVVQIAELARQQSVTTWRITIRRDDATVVAFTGATQTLEPTEAFSLQRTDSAIALFRQEGLNSQAITIDLGNSSFVYSGQSVNPLMNKVNVFAGSCQPYG